MINEITIYTDGGCWNHGLHKGTGAWAFVAIADTEPEQLVHYDSKAGEEGTTNNRMEYSALINGLEWFLASEHNPVSLTIISDSQLLLNTFTDWSHTWERRGIIDQKKNPDLVRKLLELHKRLRKEKRASVRVRWVKGHSGNKWNEYCDKLCSSIIAETTKANKSKPVLLPRVPVVPKGPHKVIPKQVETNLESAKPAFLKPQPDLNKIKTQLVKLRTEIDSIINSL